MYYSIIYCIMEISVYIYFSMYMYIFYGLGLKKKWKYTFFSGAPPGWIIFTMPPGHKQEIIFYFSFQQWNGTCITTYHVSFGLFHLVSW